MKHSAAPIAEARAAFMARIHRALERSATAVPTEPAPGVDETLARLASTRDDLPAMFTQRAQAVGMQVHPTPTEQAGQRLATLLQELDVRRVAMAARALDREYDLAQTLASSRIDVIDADFDDQYDLDAGITDVHAALAETGTLICASDATHSRGTSLVPPVHVAMVRESDILPDLIDYYARLSGIPGTDLPSSITFITGPSKTADIEGELITGVHGPGQVHILLIGA